MPAPCLVRRLFDQHGTNSPSPLVRFDEQAIELEMSGFVQDRGKADRATAHLGDEYLASFNLLDWQVDRIGMGFEVRAITFVGERGTPLQRLQGLALVGPRQPDRQRLTAL